MLVDGRVLRSFKNLAPSLRAFWLDCVVSFGPKPYILFESQRLTYDELHARAARLACVLRETYGVRKGDRGAHVLFRRRPPRAETHAQWPSACATAQNG